MLGGDGSRTAGARARRRASVRCADQGTVIGEDPGAKIERRLVVAVVVGREHGVEIVSQRQVEEHVDRLAALFAGNVAGLAHDIGLVVRADDRRDNDANG